MSLPALRRRGAALACAFALAVVLTSVSPASADDPLTRQAAALVDAVAPGTPLRVVVTTLSAAGRPSYATTAASTRTDAVALVRSALGRGLDVSMARTARVLASNDTGRSQQWALTRLRAESVWRTTRGGLDRRAKTRQAVVAVVDTGVAAHLDLGANRLSGRDFVRPGARMSDPNGHGTHVAGIVAALAGNRRGIAGLAPRARVLPVRVLDADGSGPTDVIARGIVYAADRGVQVINLSLGATGDDSALGAAVRYAQRKNVLVVAAAGNDGGGLGCLLGCPAQYPAAYPGVLGVGSVDSDGSTSGFSSRGSWVDVAAPGGAIFSTVPRGNRLGGSCQGKSYCFLSGTSMASPYAAATAALGYSEHGWRGTRLGQEIIDTATDLGSPGVDQDTGHGLVNPLALVR